MFGFVSESEVKRLIEAERRNFANEMDELERRMKRLVRDVESPPSVQQIHLSDGYMTKEELIRELAASVDEKIEEVVKATMGKMDLEDLTNAVYRDIDNDDVISGLVEALKDKVCGELDRAEIAKAIAETLCDEGFDDDFMEDISSKVVDRLQISLQSDG